MRHALQISGLNRFPFWADTDFFDDVFSPVEKKTTHDFRIDETTEAFVLSVDLPGVRQEDIRLSLSNDVLTLSGTRGRQVRSQDGKGFEVANEKFERSFTLATEIDEARIEANLDHGVLSIVLPKAESKKARSIEVQSGKSGFLSKLVSSVSGDAKGVSGQ